MKFSEALRKAQQEGVRQVKGVYIFRSNVLGVCACAAGAVAYGRGLPEDIWPGALTHTLLEYNPDFNSTVIHPTKQTEWPILSALVDLNDKNDWTFDQIITWLEQEGL